jgi:hypothetical protein
MAYCFDTSVLIECWSRSYPPDVFRVYCMNRGSCSLGWEGWAEPAE